MDNASRVQWSNHHRESRFWLEQLRLASYTKLLHKSFQHILFSVEAHSGLFANLEMLIDPALAKSPLTGNQEKSIKNQTSTSVSNKNSQFETLAPNQKLAYVEQHAKAIGFRLYITCVYCSENLELCSDDNPNQPNSSNFKRCYFESIHRTIITSNFDGIFTRRMNTEMNSVSGFSRACFHPLIESMLYCILECS